MVATRGRTFKRPWRRSCLSSKLKSSSAPIGRKDSWCFHAVGSSNAPLLGSTAAEGLPRIGRTSIATRWRSCGLPQSASCSENFVIPPDVFGQTLIAAPSLKAPMHSFVVRIALRQHVPLRACVENPQDRFKHTTRRNRFAPRTSIGNILLRKMIPDAFPLLVREPNHSTFISDRQQSAILR